MKFNDLTFTKMFFYCYVQTIQKDQIWDMQFFLITIISLCLNQRIYAQNPPINSHVQAVDGYFSKLEAFICFLSSRTIL